MLYLKKFYFKLTSFKEISLKLTYQGNFGTFKSTYLNDLINFKHYKTI
jgi:hypothetical protein